jgi:hypothetical protein
MGQSKAIHTSLRSMCMIGRDRKGNWVVQGPHGKYGGLFVNRVAALKFAMFENGTPRVAVMMPGILELNIAQAR